MKRFKIFEKERDKSYLFPGKLKQKPWLSDRIFWEGDKRALFVKQYAIVSIVPFFNFRGNTVLEEGKNPLGEDAICPTPSSRKPGAEEAVGNFSMSTKIDTLKQLLELQKHV